MTLKSYIEMLKDVVGVDTSKNNQTSSCYRFLHEGVAMTSGSGYRKVPNFWTREECIRNTTTCSPCSLNFPLGVFLLALGMLNELVFCFHKSREQKSSCTGSMLSSVVKGYGQVHGEKLRIG